MASSFLLSLLKIVTEERAEIVCWNAQGQVEIRDLKLLCEEVLPKYFRHSKYASFLRQLNNFGFRKLKGQGRGGPCVFINPRTQNKGPDSILELQRRAAKEGGAAFTQKRAQAKGEAYEMRPGDAAAAAVAAAAAAAGEGVNGDSQSLRPPRISPKSLARSAAAGTGFNPHPMGPLLQPGGMMGVDGGGALGAFPGASGMGMGMGIVGVYPMPFFPYAAAPWQPQGAEKHPNSQPPHEPLQHQQHQQQQHHQQHQPQGDVQSMAAGYTLPPGMCSPWGYSFPGSYGYVPMAAATAAPRPAGGGSPSAPEVEDCKSTTK